MHLMHTMPSRALKEPQSHILPAQGWKNHDPPRDICRPKRVTSGLIHLGRSTSRMVTISQLSKTPSLPLTPLGMISPLTISLPFLSFPGHENHTFLHLPIYIGLLALRGEPLLDRRDDRGGPGGHGRQGHRVEVAGVAGSRSLSGVPGLNNTLREVATSCGGSSNRTAGTWAKSESSWSVSG